MSDKKSTELVIKLVLDEMWVDEDGNVSEAFKNEIKAAVIHRVADQVRSQVEQEGIRKFIAEVNELSTKGAETFVSDMISKIFSEGNKFPDKDTIPSHLRGMSFKDYVWTKISNVSYNGFGDFLSKTAKAVSDDLKKRYDSVFAMKIVERLHENNMLNENVAKSLLDDKKDG